MANEKNINSRIQMKHDIEANWYAAGTAANPFIPKAGEVIIYDPDDVYENVRTKVGDGSTPVHLLPWTSGCDETVGFIFEDNGDDTYSIVGHYDDGGDWGLAHWIIPRGFCGCPVTKIDSTGYIGGITTVFIPDSIEEISMFGIMPISIETIYCEAAKMPDGWSENWMPDQYDEIKATVIWSATQDILKLNERINETLGDISTALDNIILQTEAILGYSAAQQLAEEAAKQSTEEEEGGNE